MLDDNTFTIARPLTTDQSRLLGKIGADGLAPSTLRVASELRWLEHVGLTRSDPTGRHVLTTLGERARARAADPA